MEVRQVTQEDKKSTAIENMGIIGGGCGLMRYAWPGIKVIFSIHHENDTRPPNLQDPTIITKIEPHRVWPTSWRNIRWTL